MTAQGNYLVTSPRNNFGAVNAGSVFLMDPNTGDVITTFRNPTPGTDEFFGVEVALLPNGDVVIANPSSDDLRANAGMVYVFNGTTGALLFDIPNPRVATSNQFGTQVATTPDGNILVSQHAGEFGGISEGFVYLFDGSDGTLLRTFQAPVPQRSDNFGFDIQVARNGNILVNAPGYDGLTESAGAVFVYNSNGDLLNTLAHPEPNDNEVFASYFDVIDDSLIAAYTPVWQTDIRSSGLLYIMDTNTGEMVKKIPNPTPERFEQFGRYVDVLPNGDLVIGADFDNRFGAVYIYDGSAIITGGADTIPPEITTTGDLVIEATGPDGAIADFNVTATDNVAVVIGPDCLPLSGEIFPLGTTTVTCSAEDAAGNTATETFNVTLVDTTPPELTVPQNVVVEATGPDGAIVDYLAADAFDLVGVVSGPDCFPLLGQTYSLGETIVSCSASDAAGNEATGIFTIIVQDTTEPDTTIVSALDSDNNPVLPGEFTLSDELTLEFSGSDLVTASENLVFSCRLDGGQWLPCSSPVTYQGLSVATHTIEVSATDEAGNNESSVATFSWSVVTAEDAIADAITGLEVLLLDPASNQAGKKLENAIRKAQDAIDASQQIPVNYTDVVRKIQQAVNQIDDAIRFGTAPLDAQPVLRQLTIVSREMAQSNIELALSSGGKPSKIANAQAQFAAANAEFANESYQAAIDLFLAASQEADKA